VEAAVVGEAVHLQPYHETHNQLDGSDFNSFHVHYATTKYIWITQRIANQTASNNLNS
jgi:hypothetical protein